MKWGKFEIDDCILVVLFIVVGSAITMSVGLAFEAIYSK